MYLYITILIAVKFITKFLFCSNLSILELFQDKRNYSQIKLKVVFLYTL